MGRMIRNNVILLLMFFTYTGSLIADDVMTRYQQKAAIQYQNAVGADDSLTVESSNMIDEYLQTAALNNPALNAAFLRWKAELENIPQVSSLPDPKLTYAYYIRNVETRVGPQRQKLDFTQTIPWFGVRRLRGEVSMANADMKWQAFQEQKLKLYYEVRTAYYDLYLLSRSIEIVRENMTLLESLEEVVRTRYSAGLASHADLVKVQVELGKLEERVLSLEGARPSLNAKLNATMNRPSDTMVPWPESLPDEELMMSEDALIEYAKQNNPGVTSLIVNSEREKRAVELAEKAFYPSFMVGVSWIETSDARMPGIEDSGKDPIMPMISINVPLWHGVYQAATQEAKINERAVEQTLRDKTNTLVADTKMLLYRYHDSERKVSLYRDSLLPKAYQAITVARTGYEGDNTDFLSLIDAQRTQLEFELALEQAVVARATALAGIDLIAGGINQDGE